MSQRQITLAALVRQLSDIELLSHLEARAEAWHKALGLPVESLRSVERELKRIDRVSKNVLPTEETVSKNVIPTEESTSKATISPNSPETRSGSEASSPSCQHTAPKDGPTKTVEVQDSSSSSSVPSRGILCKVSKYKSGRPIRAAAQKQAHVASHARKVTFLPQKKIKTFSINSIKERKALFYKQPDYAQFEADFVMGGIEPWEKDEIYKKNCAVRHILVNNGFNCLSGISYQLFNFILLNF